MEVLRQGPAAGRVGQEGVGGELADLDAAVEDEVGFEPGVGQEELAGALRQGVAIVGS